MHIDPLVQAKRTTIYRLYKRRGRFWADDFWALFAFVALIIQASTQLADKQVQTNNFSKTTRITAYYLMGTTFYLIIWASRLSILFSIVRIEPSAQRSRLLFWVAVIFVAAILLLFGQYFWICESNPSWKNSESVQCELPLQVGICQIVNYAYVACVKADIIADSILLLAPLPLFRNLIDKSLGYKLTLLFSSCVVTTIVSLVHAAFILTHHKMKIFISAMVEDCLSLIVANIPVVITTTIDIVGEPDQVQTGKSAPLTSVFWFRDAQTTGAMELHTIAENSVEPSCAKNTATSAWNQNGLPNWTHVPSYARMGSCATCCKVYNTQVTPILRSNGHEEFAVARVLTEFFLKKRSICNEELLDLLWLEPADAARSIVPNSPPSGMMLIISAEARKEPHPEHLLLLRYDAVLPAFDSLVDVN
ncbi:hypothetical protein B0H13DRAFT_1865867 [Mycena leptocephala]|nr:hypothetical protein B0H13DRAFT_1865867 [Mycena leptocephala]